MNTLLLIFLALQSLVLLVTAYRLRKAERFREMTIRYSGAFLGTNAEIAEIQKELTAAAQAHEEEDKPKTAFTYADLQHATTEAKEERLKPLDLSSIPISVWPDKDERELKPIKKTIMIDDETSEALDLAQDTLAGLDILLGQAER